MEAGYNQCNARINAGKILELKGFWTGCDWRIVGDRNHSKYFRIKKWTSKLEAAYRRWPERNASQYPDSCWKCPPAALTI